MDLLLPCLIILQFLIYLDRGIIPGSISSIENYITQSIKTQHPDSLIGVLQSAFVIGLSLSCPLVASLSHRIRSNFIVAGGLFLWSIGGFLAYLSSLIATYETGYFTLFTARVFSGVGEAALISLVPPLILANDKSVGIWMGSFCAMIPIGTAAGYCYASLLNQFFGWGMPFLAEALFSLPFIVFLAVLPESQTRACSPPPSQGPGVQLSPFWSDFSEVMSFKAFRWIAVIYAAYAGSIAALSTFGASFLVNLGLVQDRTTASLWMGAIVAGSGVLGGALGGVFVVDTKAATEQQSSCHYEHWEDTDTGGVGSLTISPEQRGRLVESLSAIVMLVILSVSILIASTLAVSAQFFLGGLFAGLIGLFATQAPLNVSTMLSVPTSHRACSVAFVTLILHLFGDIPAPIIVGLLKDLLAPHCSTGAKPELCEIPWLRFIVFLVAAWLSWMVIGVLAARRAASITKT